MTVRFEWDPQKAEANRLKHRVSFEEAVTVFNDPHAQIHDDPAHSTSEPREIIIGHSARGRLLLVSSRSAPGWFASSAPAGPRAMSERTSRTARRKHARSDAPANEYRFDYDKARPNRFARRVPRDAVVIILEPDVAKAIRDPRRINAILRAALTSGRRRRRRTA